MTVQNGPDIPRARVWSNPEITKLCPRVRQHATHRERQKWPYRIEGCLNSTLRSAETVGGDAEIFYKVVEARPVLPTMESLGGTDRSV